MCLIFIVLSLTTQLASGMGILTTVGAHQKAQ